MKLAVSANLVPLVYILWIAEDDAAGEEAPLE